MLILIFQDFNGNIWTLLNPPQSMVDNVEGINVNAIMKVYDLKTGEILIYSNSESFTWELTESVYNARLKECFAA